MIAQITPIGREPFDIPADDATYGDAARGGYDRATIPCVLKPWQVERILDAEVMLTSAHGECWYGRVYEHSSTGLVCVGPFSDHDRESRRAPYAVTQFLGDLKDWKNLVTEKNDAAFALTNSGGKLTICQRPGTTTSANDEIGFSLFGDVAWRRMTATVVKPHAKISMLIRTGAAEGATTITRYQSTTGATGTDAIDIDLGSDASLVIGGIITTGGTPARSDTFVSIHSMTLYGTTLTPANLADGSAVVKDSLAYVEYTIDTAHTAWVTADGTECIPLDVNGTEGDVIRKVCENSGADFARRLRVVNGLPYPVAIYKPRPTTPRYLVNVDGQSVTEDLGGGSLADMRSAITAKYKDVNDVAREVTVTDTDAAHYLVQVGRTYTESINVDTTSATRATVAATAYLASKSGITHAGTVNVIGARVATIDGTPVPPELVEAGELIQVSGTRYGEVTGYIERCDHAGEVGVRLAIDSTPTINAAVRRIIR